MALGRLDAMPTASVAAHKTTVEANARALTEREGDRPAIDENIFNLIYHLSGRANAQKFNPLNDLVDGRAFSSILQRVDKEYFASTPLAEASISESPTVNGAELKRIFLRVISFGRKVVGQEWIEALPVPDINALMRPIEDGKAKLAALQNLSLAVLLAVSSVDHLNVELECLLTIFPIRQQTALARDRPRNTSAAARVGSPWNLAHDDQARIAPAPPVHAARVPLQGAAKVGEAPVAMAVTNGARAAANEMIAEAIFESERAIALHRATEASLSGQLKETVDRCAVAEERVSYLESQVASLRDVYNRRALDREEHEAERAERSRLALQEAREIIQKLRAEVATNEMESTQWQLRYEELEIMRDVLLEKEQMLLEDAQRSSTLPNGNESTTQLLGTSKEAVESAPCELARVTLERDQLFVRISQKEDEIMELARQNIELIEREKEAKELLYGKDEQILSMKSLVDSLKSALHEEVMQSSSLTETIERKTYEETILIFKHRAHRLKFRLQRAHTKAHGAMGEILLLRTHRSRLSKKLRRLWAKYHDEKRATEGLVQSLALMKGHLDRLVLTCDTPESTSLDHGQSDESFNRGQIITPESSLALSVAPHCDSDKDDGDEDAEAAAGANAEASQATGRCSPLFTAPDVCKSCEQLVSEMAAMTVELLQLETQYSEESEKDRQRLFDTTEELAKCKEDLCRKDAALEHALEKASALEKVVHQPGEPEACSQMEQDAAPCKEEQHNGLSGNNKACEITFNVSSEALLMMQAEATEPSSEKGLETTSAMEEELTGALARAAILESRLEEKEAQVDALHLSEAAAIRDSEERDRSHKRMIAELQGEILALQGTCASLREELAIEGTMLYDMQADYSELVRMSLAETRTKAESSLQLTSLREKCQSICGCLPSPPLASPDLTADHTLSDYEQACIILDSTKAYLDALQADRDRLLEASKGLFIDLDEREGELKHLRDRVNSFSEKSFSTTGSKNNYMSINNATSPDAAIAKAEAHVQTDSTPESPKWRTASQPSSPPKGSASERMREYIRSIKEEHETILSVWHDLGARIYRSALYSSSQASISNSGHGSHSLSAAKLPSSGRNEDSILRQ